MKSWKKEIENRNKLKEVWLNLFLRICLAPAILMINIARAILISVAPLSTCLNSNTSIKNKKKSFSFTRKTSITILTIFIAMSIALNIAIAVPTTINLQGKLLSSTGSALSGTYNFTFRIYDAYTSGNLLYESNNTLTSDSRGLYNVDLRDVNLTFDQQYYLAVKIDSDAEMTPRINLSSMPYAFRANTSDDLNPNNSYTIGILNVTNNVTIGDSSEDRITVITSNLNVSTNGNLDIAGNLTLAEKIKFSLGSTIENLVSNWLRITGSLNITKNLVIGKNLTVNNSDLFVDSNLGRVGINTTTPTQTLTVVGDLNVTGASYGIDTNESARFDNLTSYDCPAGELVIGVQNNGTVLCAADIDTTIGNCSTEGSCSLITYDTELGTVLGDYWNMSRENLGWVNLTDYPSACTSGDFVTQLGDSLTCSSPSYIGNCSIDGSCDNILYESEESGLNVNRSNYWDSYNIPTDLNNLLTLHWDNVTNRPSDCGAGDFVRGIDGTTLDCATPSYTTDTNCSAIGSCSDIYYYQGLNAANITSGNLDIARIPTGGSWSLSSDLNIDSNTLVVDYDGDKVGIGTATPTQTLTVVGDLNVTGTSSNSTFEGDVTIKGTLYGGSLLKVGNGLNITSGDLIIANGNITDNNGTVLTTPSGIIAVFDTDCPKGWTRVNALDGKFLVGNSSYSAAAGGSDSVTLTVDNLPSHTHGAGTLIADSAGAHTHTFSDTVSQYTSYTDTAHTHSIDPPSTSTSTSGAHTHEVYKYSDEDAGGGTGVSSYYDYGQGTRTGALSAGSHSHTVDIAAFTSGSGGSNHRHSLSDYTASGTTSSDGAHTHTISGSTGSTGSDTAFDNRPAFATVVICKKDVGSDYAEWIKSKEKYKPGTVVSADPDAEEQIKISEKAYDSAVLGIISTAPGWIVGMEDDDSLMMALSGRVPAIVAVKNNEEIKPGDPITTSALPGIGMKATKPGSIIGKALESFEAKECKDISSLEEITWLNDEDCFKLPDGTYISKITVLVSVSYWEPENYEEEQNEKIETNTESIAELKQQIKDQQTLLEKAFTENELQQKQIEQLKAIICLDHPEASICSSKVNTTGLAIIEREPDVTEDEGSVIEQKQSTEELHSWQREYPEIKEMFQETGSTLKNVLEEKGYKVTLIERSKGIKEGFESIYKNYALVAIEKKGLENIFNEGSKISEDVIPYIKSYYPDSDIWIIFIHDTSPEGNQVQCIYSIPELNIGGCTSTPSWDLIFTEQESKEIEKQTEAPSEPQDAQENITEQVNITETNVTLAEKTELKESITSPTNLTNNTTNNQTDQRWYHIVNTVTATITSSGLINYIVLFLLI